MKSSCLLLPFSACSLLPVALDPGIYNFPVAGSGTREADLFIYSTRFLLPSRKADRDGGNFPIILSVKAKCQRSS